MQYWIGLISILNKYLKIHILQTLKQEFNWIDHDKNYIENRTGLCDREVGGLFLDGWWRPVIRGDRYLGVQVFS